MAWVRGRAAASRVRPLCPILFTLHDAVLMGARHTGSNNEVSRKRHRDGHPYCQLYCHCHCHCGGGGGGGGGRDGHGHCHGVSHIVRHGVPLLQRRRRRGGVLVALVCVSTLCLAQTLLGLFSPLGAGQVASFVFFGFYRAFLFALLPMYMMTVHGPLYFGTLTGLAGFIASMVSLVQYPLLQLVLGSLGGDFAPVTRGFAVAIACGLAFPLILFFKWGRRGMPPPRGVGSVGGRGKESPLAVPPAGREGGGGSSGGGGGQVEEGGSNTGRPVVSGGSGASDQIVPVPAAVHDEVC